MAESTQRRTRIAIMLVAAGCAPAAPRTPVAAPIETDSEAVPIDLRGRIVTADEKQPIPGATVRVHAVAWPRPPDAAPALATARTAADGSFALELRPPAGVALDVMIEAPRHASLRAQLAPVHHDTAIDLGTTAMRPLVMGRLRFVGQVDDEPVPRLSVRIAHRDPPEPAPQPRLTIGPEWCGWTDARGEVRVPLCAGTWSVSWAEGRSASRFEVPDDVASFEREIRARHVHPARLIGGRLVEHDGTPIAAATVCFAAGAERHTLSTDAGGRFSFSADPDAPPATRFHVELAPELAARFRLAEPDRSLGIGEHGVEITLRRRPLHRTRLRLRTDGGRAVAHCRFAWVRETAAGVPAALSGLLEAADGEYILPPAPADPLALWILPEPPEPVPLAILRTVPNEEHALELTLGSPRPHVVRIVDRDGAGIANVDVWLQLGGAAPDGDGEPIDVATMLGRRHVETPLRLAAARTGADGAARIEVPPDVEPLEFAFGGDQVVPRSVPFTRSARAARESTHVVARVPRARAAPHRSPR